MHLVGSSSSIRLLSLSLLDGVERCVSCHKTSFWNLRYWKLSNNTGKERWSCAIFPSVHYHCWLGVRKGIWPVNSLVLVCWWWRFDWSFARLIAPIVTTHQWRSQEFAKGDKTEGLGDGSPQRGPGAPFPSSLSSVKPVNPGLPGKWPLKWIDMQTERVVRYFSCVARVSCCVSTMHCRTSVIAEHWVSAYRTLQTSASTIPMHLSSSWSHTYRVSHLRIVSIDAVDVCNVEFKSNQITFICFSSLYS